MLGGLGSGRILGGGGITVEDCLTLDVNKLVRDGLVGVGHRAGTLVWTQRGTGEKVGAVSYEILNNGPNDVRLRLTYTHRGRVKDGRTDESVWFDTSHPHFGGVRWWFTCPRCGRRAAKLHLPPGGDLFLCRRCWGLSYESQRESPMFRALSQAQKIRSSLGGSTDTTAPFPPRPKGMHRRTYRSLRKKARRYEGVTWSFAESKYGLSPY
ncbi:hypothetical protein FAK_14990 [Desulfoferula mesophila]|uniref:Uncharacterized protein n=1 Tax=Desulfoferula mesophila TaxID=3058419 RepID=A0AAU9EBC1_9BACT|nr:hypothetical protein FAK_14990 [Desulfoferula mesophilus]